MPTFIRALAAMLLTFLLATTPTVFAADPTTKAEWLELFNGEDLNDWTVKITGQPLGQDKHQTFRVSNGILEVRYDQYTAFDNQFGHLFFNQPFAHYELLVEYRFVGEQLRGGPGWATRNSGVMLHAQEPASMSVDQDFPDSVEAQFLGGFSDNQPRPTGNVCTPGTEVMLDDALAPHHCSYSSSATFDGDQWVQIRIVVNGHGDIIHTIGDEAVMRYHSAQLSENASSAGDNPSLKLEGGYIALQSESHPIDFRRVALRVINAP